MNTNLILDIITAICLIVGSLMSLAAVVGLVRFPDLLTRLHAGTKPQIFGIMLLLLAVGLHNRSWEDVPVLILIMVLQMITIPISGHMMARSGYRNKHFRKTDLRHDDLRRLVDEVEGR